MSWVGVRSQYWIVRNVINRVVLIAIVRDELIKTEIKKMQIFLLEPFDVVYT